MARRPSPARVLWAGRLRAIACFRTPPSLIIQTATMSDPTPPVSYTFEVPAYPQVFVAAPARRRPLLAAPAAVAADVLTTLVVGARLQYNFVHDLPAFTTDNSRCRCFPCTGSGRIRRGC